MGNQTSNSTNGDCCILHLSDLHFGPHRRESGEHIIEKIIEDISSLKLKIASVVITGDIVETPIKKQYSLALEGLQKLQEGIGVEKKRWVIVPGNHDVNLQLCKSGSVIRKKVAPSKLIQRKFENYKQFLSGFYCQEFSNDQIVQFVNGGATVDVNESIPITIGVLNSCEHVAIGDSTGYIGDDQLTRLSNNFQMSHPKMSDLRIVAMHHSFLPTAGHAEYVANYEELRRKLELLNVRIVLHGHRHVSCPDVIRRPWEEAELIVLPTGSANLEASVLGDIRNRYQIVSVRARKKIMNLAVYMRAFEPKQSSPSLQGVWCPDVAYAENGVLKMQLRNQPVPSPSPSSELTWDNGAVLVSIRRSIPVVTNYVQVGASQGSRHVGSIDPTILYPEHLGSVKRILIVGTCGVGKSTTLTWLSRECLKKEHRAKLKRLPIFFDLKKYSSSATLWGNILRFLKECIPDESLSVLKIAKDKGGLLFFLDSLDEVADKKVLEEIEGLVTQGNIVVVACRSSFYFLENMYPLLANYSKIELGEWSREQIDSFLRIRLFEKLKAEETKAFQQDIPAWIRTPLLAELYAQLQPFSSRYLTQLQHKSTLYHEIIDRAVAYSGDNIAKPRKYIETREKLIIEIAWQMFVQSKGWLSVDELEDVISKTTRPSIEFTQEMTRNSLLDSPLLMWSQNKIAFRHIAFQEYLVAIKIVQLIRSGISKLLPPPRDETITFVAEMIDNKDLPKLADWATSSGQYWILGLLSRFSSELFEIYEYRLEQLFQKFETEQSRAVRLIWCVGELRLRSRKIKLFLEKIFERCNEETADIAWFAAFAIEKIWAINQLPHYALRKLVTKYPSATDVSLNSKLSCILSIARRYRKKSRTPVISERQVIRVIKQAEFVDPCLYNSVWIAGESRLQSASDSIIDLISAPPIQTNLFIYNCAIEALGKIGNTRSLEALVAMLRHPSLRLRWRALEALSRNSWGREQLRHTEFASIAKQIFSQINLVGSPFERERVKKTKRLIGITDKKGFGGIRNQ
jgi:hypothetical protein